MCTLYKPLCMLSISNSFESYSVKVVLEMNAEGKKEIGRPKIK